MGILFDSFKLKKDPSKAKLHNRVGVHVHRKHWEAKEWVEEHWDSFKELLPMEVAELDRREHLEPG